MMIWRDFFFYFFLLRLLNGGGVSEMENLEEFSKRCHSKPLTD